MRLISESGNITMGARAAWHWAFDTNVSSIDMREILDHFGVQFTAKGADNQVMAHCEKGRIQQVIYNMKLENKEAWAWGMIAYAPDGTENANLLRNILMPYAFKAASTPKFNAFTSTECGQLAFIAINDAAIESRKEDGQRHKRKRLEMSGLLGCSVEEYQNKWAPKLYAMKDALKDLDGKCLPPIFDAMALMVGKYQQDLASVIIFRQAMRTPGES